MPLGIEASIKSRIETTIAEAPAWVCICTGRSQLHGDWNLVCVLSWNDHGGLMDFDEAGAGEHFQLGQNLINLIA